MPKNNVDLINDPVRRAQEMARAQLASFREQVMPEQRDPLREQYKQKGVRLEGLRRAFRNGNKS